VPAEVVRAGVVEVRGEVNPLDGGAPFGPAHGIYPIRAMVSGPHDHYPFRVFISGGNRMDVLTWLLVGLVAGVLASFVMGGIGYGIVGDIIVGIVGAVLGGWLFAQMGWTTPFSGVGGVIFVAFIGALLLLFILGVLGRGRRRGPP
jgi:uncharacterized membrane protein YeaQ/YmgE (transglycosylase-associated protein family)